MSELVQVDPLVDSVQDANELFANCSEDELTQIIGYYECALAVDDPEECRDVAVLSDGCTGGYVSVLAAELPLSSAECSASKKSATVALASYYPNAEADHLDPRITVASRFSGQADGGYAFIGTEGTGVGTICHVGIRGTDNGTDVMIDVKSYGKSDCTPGDGLSLGRCGAGFLTQFKSLESIGLVSTLNEMVRGGQCQGGVRIHGHSLGGALASLLAADLYESNPSVYTPDTMKVHTFGEPRVLDDASADKYQGLIAKIRWLNYGDPVPSGIGSTLGFRHFGTARLISSSYSLWGSTTYSFVEKAQDFTTHNLGPVSVSRHKMASYIDRLSHCD